MKFSVLIPICNKEKVEYLKDALDSIIKQTKRPNQIVIVKDGQLSEQLNDIIKIYKNEYPMLIDILNLDKQNSLGKVLNEGLKICKNEYVARMDSDDIARIDRFEKQINYLDKHPDIDVLGGYIEEYDKEMRRKKSIKKVPLTQEEIYINVSKQNPFNHSTVILKKQSVLKIGGYKDCQLEDYDLWIRMIVNKNKMRNLSDILVDYRTNIDMYRRRTGKKYLKGILNIEKTLLNNKLITKYQYKKNILLRTILALIPSTIKMIIYPKVIRKVK